MPKTRVLPASYSSNRRWTRDDARTVVTAQAASGLSVAAFAAREGIDLLPAEVTSYAIAKLTS